MDATTIVAATANGELRTWRHFGDEWQPGPSLRSSGSPIQAAALSPDGQRMVFSDIDGAPYRWELADAYATKHTNAYAFVAALAFSPDGRWLAAGGRGSGANLQIWRWGPGMFRGRSHMTADGRSSAVALPRLCRPCYVRDMTSVHGPATRVQGAGRTTRNPWTWIERSGEYPLREAARAIPAPLLYEPPRTTRWRPSGAPNGLLRSAEA